MNPSTNDFANRELSIEELEAIAAGGFWGSVGHFISNEWSAAVRWAESPTGLGTIIRGIGSVLGWL